MGHRLHQAFTIGLRITDPCHPVTAHLHRQPADLAQQQRLLRQADQCPVAAAEHFQRTVGPGEALVGQHALGHVPRGADDPLHEAGLRSHRVGMVAYPALGAVWRHHAEFRLGVVAHALAQRFVDHRSRSRGARHRPFEAILAAEARYLLGEPAFRRRIAQATKTDDRIFLVVSSLLNRIFQRYVERIREAPTMDLMRVVKELVALVSSNVSGQGLRHARAPQPTISTWTRRVGIRA